MEDNFFWKNYLLFRCLSFFAEINLETWRSFFPKLTKLHFTCQEKFFGKFFWKKLFFKKYWIITFFIMTFGSYRDIFGGSASFFYSVNKIAFNICGIIFSRKKSFLKETFPFMNTLWTSWHLENLEEKCFYFEKIEVCAFVWDCEQKFFEYLARFFLLVCHYSVLRIEANFFRENLLFYRIFSIFVSSGTF